MADITTDVLIVGTGPAGSATAALLSSYGIENFLINQYRWLANTPRAHITNQRCMEVLTTTPHAQKKSLRLCSSSKLPPRKSPCLP